MVKLEDYFNDVDKTVKVYETMDENGHHMSYGIATELGELFSTLKKHVIYEQELDLENVKEEVGDILFYYFNLVKFSQKEDQYSKALENVNKLVDKINNSETDFYIKELNPLEVFKLVVENPDYVLAFTLSLLKSLEIDLEEVLEKNQKKLQKRYPDGYSNKNAEKRIDKNG